MVEGGGWQVEGSGERTEIKVNDQESVPAMQRRLLTHSLYCPALAAASAGYGFILVAGGIRG